MDETLEAEVLEKTKSIVGAKAEGKDRVQAEKRAETP